MIITTQRDRVQQLQKIFDFEVKKLLLSFRQQGIILCSRNYLAATFTSSSENLLILGFRISPALYLEEIFCLLKMQRNHNGKIQ